MRVLVVNDAPVESAVLARMLRELGHEVVAIAVDLPSALDHGKALAPDLAVIDGRLPPDGGLSALRAFRTVSPGTSVAVIASLAEIELVRAAVAAGAAGALRRPLLRGQVEAALRDLI